MDGTEVAGLSALAAARPGRTLAPVDDVGTRPVRFHDLDVWTGVQRAVHQ